MNAALKRIFLKSSQMQKVSREKSRVAWETDWLPRPPARAHDSQRVEGRKRDVAKPFYLNNR